MEDIEDIDEQDDNEQGDDEEPATKKRKINKGKATTIGTGNNTYKYGYKITISKGFLL